MEITKKQIKFKLLGGGNDELADKLYFNDDTQLKKTKGKGIIESLSNKNNYKIFNLGKKFIQD